MSRCPCDLLIIRRGLHLLVVKTLMYPLLPPLPLRSEWLWLTRPSGETAPLAAAEPPTMTLFYCCAYLMYSSALLLLHDVCLLYRYCCCCTYHSKWQRHADIFHRSRPLSSCYRRVVKNLCLYHPNATPNFWSCLIGSTCNVGVYMCSTIVSTLCFGCWIVRIAE